MKSYNRRVNRALAFSIFISFGAFAFINSHPVIGSDSSMIIAKAQDSDAFIAEQLRSAIQGHPALSQRPIEVASKEQVVTLSGSVANDVEARDLLVRARNLPGVRMVRMNLKINPAAGTKLQHVSERAQEVLQEGKQNLQEVRQAADEVVKEATETVFDARITAVVKWKLLEEQKQAASDIHVETNKAVVVLSGKVDNLSQARKAQELAASVTDVVRVDSRLAIINPDTGS